MAVEKAPYVNYTELTSYPEYSNEGSEIPLFIVKTNNVVNVADITSKKVLKISSYAKFKKEFGISNEKKLYDKLDDSIKELDRIMKDFFNEDNLYGGSGEYGIFIPYIYIIDVGKNSTLNHYLKALEVSEVKRNSTAVVFPNLEDVEFMNSVKQKLQAETKNGLLRIGYFGVSGQGKLDSKFISGILLIPTLNYAGYVNIKDGYLKEDVQKFYEEDTFVTLIPEDISYIYHDLTSDKYYVYRSGTLTEVNLSDLGGYTEVIEAYVEVEGGVTHLYEDSVHEKEITSPNPNAIYVNAENDVEAYAHNGTGFIKINVQKKDGILNESDVNAKFFKPSSKIILGGNDETFDDYVKRMTWISQKVLSPRVAIIENDDIGKTIARICSTPYYIEPGYLPYLSISPGVFKERTTDERDSLFGSGLIFNEDDYFLSSITPRICLATSTAWGIEDHDMRLNDALIHARRNVDYHIRHILEVLGPQIKRNETSVNLRFLQIQIDNYLDEELNNGTIMEYEINIQESSYNPYYLIVVGKITPVNSTLAIGFENRVGQPHTISTEYV